MVDRFTNEEIAAFRRTFQLFDVDRDGVIMTKEAGDVMREHGVCISQGELNRLVAEVDKKNTHRLDFPQFLAVMAEKYFEDTEDEDRLLRDAFKVFDREGNGFISCQELHRILISLGESLTRQEADRMILQADSDSDGQISIDEFLALLSGESPAPTNKRPGFYREHTQMEFVTKGKDTGGTFLTRSKVT